MVRGYTGYTGGGGRRGRRGFVQLDTAGYGMVDRDERVHGPYGVNMFPRPGRRGGWGRRKPV